MSKRRPNTQRSVGIDLFGWVLIGGSVFQMVTLLNFEHYQYLFQDLPRAVMIIRYVVSWVVRVVSVCSGVGLLRRNDLARRIAITVCWLTIVTVYWKHPYAGFRRHTQYLDEFARTHLGPPWGESITFSAFTLHAVVLARLLDILFAGCLIYYFTRPHITAQFASSRHATRS